jgi:hypothetical protein
MRHHPCRIQTKILFLSRHLASSAWTDSFVGLSLGMVRGTQVIHTDRFGMANLSVIESFSNVFFDIAKEHCKQA